MESADAPKLLPRSRILLGSLALALVILAVFYPALAGDFVYDDLLVIQQNPQISKLSNLGMIFGSSYWDFLDSDAASHVGYYRPLTMVLMTLANVWGDGQPAVFHWTSLVVYAASCIAGWRFAARLLRSEGAGFLAALLFAVHPLHVESVAWISALHDPLFALFGFLALERSLRWRDEGAKGLPLASGVWFLLALLSKDAAVAILPIALTLDCLRRQDGAKPSRPTRSSVLRGMTPLVLAFLGYYALRVVVFGEPLAGFNRMTTEFGVDWTRLALLRVELLGGAMSLLVWPAELNLFRPFQPELPPGSPELLTGIVGSVILLIVLTLAWMRRWRTAFSLLLLIPLALAPVLLKVESLGTFPLSDRFLFIPVLAVTGLMAHLAWSRLPHGAAIGLCLLVTAALGLRSARHLPNWASEEALFRNAVEQNPRNPNVFWGLGRVLLNRYQQTGVSDPLLEARIRFDAAMDLLAEAQKESGKDIYATHDDHLQTNLGLGWSLLFEAQVDGFHDYGTVREVFQRVIEYQPRSELGYIGLGVAWLLDDNPNEASVALRKALVLNPYSPEAHRNMAVLYMRIQEWDLAVKELESCLELRNTNDGRDLVYLARAQIEAGDDAGALRSARRAHELRPDDPDPLVLLGQGAEKAGQYPAALDWYDRAIEMSPTHGTAHRRRGKVLAAQGQNQSAVRAMMKACQYLPTSFEAHHDLMVLLLASSDPEKALPYFLVAYRTRPAAHNLRMRKVAAAMHRDNLEILGALATIDLDLGDLNTAGSWITQAMELDATNPAINFTYGVLLLNQGTPELAEAPLKLAASKLPGSFLAQMEYADLLLELNREFDAEPHLKRALALLADDEMAESMKTAIRKTLITTLQDIEAMKRVGPPDKSGG